MKSSIDDGKDNIVARTIQRRGTDHMQSISHLVEDSARKGFFYTLHIALNLLNNGKIN